MNATRTLLLTSAILLALAGCARREDDSGDEAPITPATGDTAPAAVGTTATSGAAGDSTDEYVQGPQIVAPIQVEVVLTPAAKAELSAKSEGVVVEAMYGGDPNTQGAARVNEFGLVELGKVQKELPAAGGKVGFDKDAINASRLSLVLGQPQVMINVRSARKTVPKNLLSCELYWDSVESASETPIQIPCRLLSEPAPVRPPPPPLPPAPKQPPVASPQPQPATAPQPSTVPQASTSRDASGRRSINDDSRRLLPGNGPVSASGLGGVQPDAPVTGDAPPDPDN